MVYKNKTYIAFDGDTDIEYYRTLQMWKENKNIDFEFYDAHDLNTARDTSLTESIKNQLRERFENSKLFMILVGEKTKSNRKFIPWEIEQALERNLPIIVIYLNNSRHINYATCPTPLQNVLSIHIPFKLAIIKYAFENWPARHFELQTAKVNSPRIYKEEVYKGLGL